MSVTPENAVMTDPVIVEQEPSRETRHRLEELKTDPDGLDDKDAEGGAAPGDPASIRSSYRASTCWEVFARSTED
jgi:hypothetical protein